MAAQLTALSIMQDVPVIPVIVLRDVDHAVSMAKALVAGGIRVLEVTLRTPQGLPSIEAIAKAVPEAIVGAGTVRSAADAKAAAAAGARFAVSPGYTHSVGQACRDLALPLLPGVAGWGKAADLRITARFDSSMCQRLASQRRAAHDVRLILPRGSVYS